MDQTTKALLAAIEIATAKGASALKDSHQQDDAAYAQQGLERVLAILNAAVASAKGGAK